MTALTKIIIMSVAGAVVTAIFGWFVIEPAWSSVYSASEQLKQNQGTLMSLDQQLVALRAAQTDIKKATKAGDITGWVLDREQMVTAVAELERAAAQSGVVEIIDIQNPDPTDPKADLVPGKRGVDEIHYRMATSSDFLGAINFLTYLEHLPHWTEISKINFSAEIKQADNGKTVRTGKVLGTIDGVFFVNHTSNVQN